MPPSCASAMARRASVTVSIAAETSGTLRRMLRVSGLDRSVSRGRICEKAGTSNTSSKVSALPSRRMGNAPAQKEIIGRGIGTRLAGGRYTARAATLSQPPGAAGRSPAPCGHRGSPPTSRLPPSRSLPLRSSLTSLVALLAFGAALPAAAQWKWRDRAGQRAVQRPAAAGRHGRRRHPAAAGGGAAAPRRRYAASAARRRAPHRLPAPKASEPELEARRRKAEQDEAARRRKVDELRQAAVRADNCLRARNQLRALDDGQRMTRYNAAGEREFLDDEARAAEAQRVRAAMASDCR